MSWYEKGLYFRCTGCGKCCTGAPGVVWVSDAEVHEMAAFLNITAEEFTRTYTRLIDNKLSLLEHPRTFDCVFLKDKKCMVYGARPKQCRTFPFWKENLKSKEKWEEAARRCEGINAPDAPLISIAEIKTRLT